MAADGAGADAHEGDRPFVGQAGDQFEAALDIDDRDRVRAVEAVAEGLAGPEVALAEGVFEVPAVPDGRARARAKADVEQDRVRPRDVLDERVEFAAGVAEGVNGKVMAVPCGRRG